MTWNHGRLRSGLKMNGLPEAVEFCERSELPGDRSEDSFSDSREDSLLMGGCSNDLSAGAHAQI